MLIRRRPVRRLAFCIASAMALSLGAGAGFAANPPGGTLTDASGPITYTAGPFFTSNASAQANGTPICNAALACDDFALTVSLSPDSDASPAKEAHVYRCIDCHCDPIQEWQG